jgi:hypothetical protein
VLKQDNTATFIMNANIATSKPSCSSKLFE